MRVFKILVAWSIIKKKIFYGKTKRSNLVITLHKTWSFPLRISSFVETRKGKLHLLCSFNCPVIWMFYSQALNNKINRLHERCLLIIYNDKTSTFNELLEKDNSVCIHYKNIQALAIEIYKVANGFSPVIMNEIIQLKEESHYNLRYTSKFVIPPIHSVYHGSESASYLRPKIWKLNPRVIWQIESFDGFKKEKNKTMETN